MQSKTSNCNSKIKRCVKLTQTRKLVSERASAPNNSTVFTNEAITVLNKQKRNQTTLFNQQVAVVQYQYLFSYFMLKSVGSVSLQLRAKKCFNQRKPHKTRTLLMSYETRTTRYNKLCMCATIIHIKPPTRFIWRVKKDIKAVIRTSTYNILPDRSVLVTNEVTK